MLIYSLMKFLEHTPTKYDFLMKHLTFNNHANSREIILSKIMPQMDILDIGCGPGTLSIKCAEKGATVTAIDASVQMIDMFKENIKKSSVKDKVEIISCGSASIDRVLGDRRYDIIIASLMLGELSTDLRIKTLDAAKKLLKDDGRIIVCDEFWPTNIWGSLLFYIVFIASFIPNFILTRTLIRPLKKFSRDLTTVGLTIVNESKLLFGTLLVLDLAVRSDE